MPPARRWIFPLLAGLPGLAAWLAWSWPGRTLYLRDLTFLFQPWRQHSHERLAAGELPIWNPYNYGGIPFLASPQTSLLYPGSVPFHLAGFGPGLKIFTAMHLGLAGALGWLWASSAGLRPAGRAFLALLASANGFFLSRVEFPPMFSGLAWLWAVPILGRTSVFPLGAVFAAVLLAGHPWPVIFLLPLALLAGGGRRIPAACAVAAGIAAVQILPSIGLFLESVRREEIGATGEAVPLAGLGGWIGLPFATFGPGKTFAGETSFWPGSFWIGVVGVLAALVGFRRKPAWAAACLAAIFLAIAEGPGPKWTAGLLRQRHPAQWMGMAMIAASFSAASAVSRLTARRILWGAPLVGVLAVELGLRAIFSQPTVEAEFFRRKGPITMFLKRIGTAEESRFWTSPAVRDQPGFWVPARLGAQAVLRDPYRGLISTAFRLRNLEGSGEPLRPGNLNKFLSDLAAMSSAGPAARPLAEADVRYLVGLNRPGAYPPSVWRRTLAYGEVALYENRLWRRRQGWRRLSAEKWRWEKPSADRIVLPERYSRGWQAWRNGRRLPLKEADGWKISLEPAGGDPAPQGPLWLVYRPWTVPVGALIALGVLSACIFRFARRDRVGVGI